MRASSVLGLDFDLTVEAGFPELRLGEVHVAADVLDESIDAVLRNVAVALPGAPLHAERHFDIVDAAQHLERSARLFVGVLGPVCANGRDTVGDVCVDREAQQGDFVERAACNHLFERG